MIYIYINIMRTDIYMSRLLVHADQLIFLGTWCVFLVSKYVCIITIN